MKKIFYLTIMLCFMALYSIAGTINVSTATSSSGGALSNPTPDPFWKVSAANGNVASNTPFVVSAYLPYWEPSPVTGTNAGWLNPVPQRFVNDTGTYTFERPFTIAPCTDSFVTNFSVAIDDTLQSVELVSPSGVITVLPRPPHSRFLQSPIVYKISCPAAGTWRIRVKVFYYDVLGAFMLSGYINYGEPNCCDKSCTVLVNVPQISPKNYACGSTYNVKCNADYTFNRRIACQSTTSCGTTTFKGTTLKDNFNNTPAWAASFIASSSASTTLAIPAGATPGMYTITYYYGKGNNICDSCKIILNLTCSPAEQRFVNTYGAASPCSNDTSRAGNLIFNSITRSKKTAATFYVAGVQDSSVYVAEVDALGVVLQQKLVGVSSKTYSLRSMITDDDGNIVIVGSMDLAATATTPVRSFVMKLSPALSILLHRTYQNLLITGSNQAYFLDVKDNKASGQYYISGTVRRSTTQSSADVLLLKVDRNTGNIISIKSQHAGEDGYDALVFAPGNVDSNSNLIATGRLSHVGTTTMRPWNNMHDKNLDFVRGRRYIQDESVKGRLYSSSLINDQKDILYAWHGDWSATSDIGINTGIASFNAGTLVPNWQREYTLTPAPATTTTRKFFNKVASDPTGYVAEGNWFDNVSRSTIDNGALGEMFLLRTDKSGNAVWSRRVRNVWVNGTTHNAAFVVEGSNIFAVGYKINPSTLLKEGVIVKLPLFDGTMDTTCAAVQKVEVKDIKFDVADVVINVDIRMKDSVNYFPINCTGTNGGTQCTNPCESDTAKLNADFALLGYLPTGNPAYFQILANSFSTSPNSQWIVSRTSLVGPSYPDIAGTIYTSIPSGTSGSVWAIASTTQFGGYNGTAGPITETNTPTPASFAVGQRYRFRHILSSTNNCGITKSDTVVKTISMCPSCKGNKVIVETEKGPSSELKREVAVTSNQLKENELNVRIMPNPVSGSTITLEYATQNNSPVQVNIQDMQGRKLVSKQFTSGIKASAKYSMDVSTLPNGAYVMVIDNNGKTTTQKFVVAK